MCLCVLVRVVFDLGAGFCFVVGFTGVFLFRSRCPFVFSWGASGLVLFLRCFRWRFAGFLSAVGYLVPFGCFGCVLVNCLSCSPVWCWCLRLWAPFFFLFFFSAVVGAVVLSSSCLGVGRC